MPAAAVIRGMQALSGITGRKASAGGFIKSFVKAWGPTSEQQRKLKISSMVEVEGISSGAVKCVDIGKNTDGESTLLGHY